MILHFLICAYTKTISEVLFACSFSWPALSFVLLTGEAHFDLLSLTGR